MDTIQSSIERIMTMRRETGQASSTAVKEEGLCPDCGGLGFILRKLNTGQDVARACKCQEVLKFQRMLKAAGISEASRSFTFDSYVPYEYQTRAAKSMAEEYCSDFLYIEGTWKNSICFLGQVGSGKTHLSLSILNILFDMRVGVLYMPYRSAITELKQNVMDDEAYSRLMDTYKKARVLLIDDFAKGAKTAADVNYMFDIVNDRYLNNKPIILSSELDMDGLLAFDAAVGSRIIEMCKGHIAYLHGEDKNYRRRR